MLIIVQHILTIKTRLMFVYVYIVYKYIYICNELIEETAGRRKLILGMLESFGYGSTSYELRAKCRLIMEL